MLSDEHFVHRLNTHVDDGHGSSSGGGDGDDGEDTLGIGFLRMRDLHTATADTLNVHIAATPTTGWKHVGGTELGAQAAALDSSDKLSGDVSEQKSWISPLAVVTSVVVVVVVIR